MVFPTLGDPHGLVVEEAMSAGLPVICSSAAGDIAERLPDGEAGYIVAPRAPQLLAQRMLALALDERLRSSMSTRAAALAQTRGHERYAEEPSRRSWPRRSRGPREGAGWAAARRPAPPAERSRSPPGGHAPSPLLNPPAGADLATGATKGVTV